MNNSKRKYKWIKNKRKTAFNLIKNYLEEWHLSEPFFNHLLFCHWPDSLLTKKEKRQLSSNGETDELWWHSLQVFILDIYSHICLSKTQPLAFHTHGISNTLTQHARDTKSLPRFLTKMRILIPHQSLLHIPTKTTRKL